MAFLPENYEAPKSGGAYFKPQQGENKLRILGNPILGNVGWKTVDGKRTPVRVRMGESLPADVDEVKHFWALPIYDYREKSIKVWEITQATIRETIEHLSKDEDWGDPLEYGLTVTKTGEKMETKYTVTPAPKKPLPDEILEEWAKTPVNLEALYDNGDPFAVGNAPAESEEEDDVPF